MSGLDLKGWVPDWITEKLLEDIPLKLARVRSHFNPGEGLSAATIDGEECDDDEAEDEEGSCASGEDSSSTDDDEREQGKVAEAVPEAASTKKKVRAQDRLRGLKKQKAHLQEPVAGTMMSPRMKAMMGPGQMRRGAIMSPRYLALPWNEVCLQIPLPF